MHMTGLSPPTDRVVSVLNLLAREHAGLSASAIARRVHVTSSTCATLLLALESADYVERYPVAQRKQAHVACTRDAAALLASGLDGDRAIWPDQR